MSSSGGGGDGAGERFGDAAVVARLAVLIDGLALDCECRSRLDEVLIRFGRWEKVRARLQQLSAACVSRERIEAISLSLHELDELGANEPDRSVYAEMALLFDEIADIAAVGAHSLRQLSTSRI
jgi:hypothetical protein